MLSSVYWGVSKALSHPLRAAQVCLIVAFLSLRIYPLPLNNLLGHLGLHPSFCNKGWETSVVTPPKTLQPMIHSYFQQWCLYSMWRQQLGAVPSHNSVSHWEKANLFSLYSTHFSVPEAPSRKTSCQRKIKIECKIIQIPELFSARPMSSFLIQIFSNWWFSLTSTCWA